MSRVCRPVMEPGTPEWVPGERRPTLGIHAGLVPRWSRPPAPRDATSALPFAQPGRVSATTRQSIAAFRPLRAHTVIHMAVRRVLRTPGPAVAGGGPPRRDGCPDPPWDGGPAPGRPRPGRGEAGRGGGGTRRRWWRTSTPSQSPHRVGMLRVQMDGDHVAQLGQGEPPLRTGSRLFVKASRHRRSRGRSPRPETT